MAATVAPTAAACQEFYFRSSRGNGAYQLGSTMSTRFISFYFSSTVRTRKYLHARVHITKPRLFVSDYSFCWTSKVVGQQGCIRTCIPSPPDDRVSLDAPPVINNPVGRNYHKACTKYKELLIFFNSTPPPLVKSTHTPCHPAKDPSRPMTLCHRERYSTTKCSRPSPPMVRRNDTPKKRVISPRSHDFWSSLVFRTSRRGTRHDATHRCDIGCFDCGTRKNRVGIIIPIDDAAAVAVDLACCCHCSCTCNPVSIVC
jgi:hypothetical protein